MMGEVLEEISAEEGTGTTKKEEDLLVTPVRRWINEERRQRNLLDGSSRSTGRRERLTSGGGEATHSERAYFFCD